MNKTQPTYTKEFKQQAVQLFKTSGKSKTHIARDLGISDSALSKWCKEFDENGKEAFPGKGHQTAIEEELRSLKRENAHTQARKGYIKKSGEHLRAAPSVKFRFLREHRHLFPIVRMCQVLEVSENGYYHWCTRGKSKRKQDDEQLAERTRRCFSEK